ncbi:MAG: hypothetical protein H6742_12140 [Alphaproteobacteria bacterium]|nr:hypothetical protein [Alphaproteobacteria bacterium]
MPALPLLLAVVACKGGDVDPVGSSAPDPADWTPVVFDGGWPTDDTPAIPVGDALASLDWLADVSHYRLVGVSGSRREGGTLGLGNGRVFGLVGLDSPWNTLTNAVGPGYQRDAGFFGDSAVLLVDADGAEIAWTTEQLERPRGTAMARTLGEGDGLRLVTTDAADPDADVLMRHIVVENVGDQPAAPSVRITLARADDEVPPTAAAALLQVRGDRALRIACLADAVTTDAGDLELAVGELAPGQAWSTTCTWAFTTGDPDDPASWPAAVTDPVDLLERSRAAVATDLDAAVALDLPDAKVEDLVEGMLVTLWTQTDAGGQVSPMNRYTTAWLRDAEGPVRLWLRAGLHERVRAVLEGQYRAAVVDGAIRNSWPLDLDLSGFADPTDPDAFWAAADFMPGREPAEAPSYPPIHAARYVAASGDAAWLDAPRLAFLEACVRGQDPDLHDLAGDTWPESALLPFSGDETWRYMLAFATTGQEPETWGWSAHSSLLLVAAVDALAPFGADPALAELGERVGDAMRAAYLVEDDGLRFLSPIHGFDGETWPAPFEDVSTQPEWLDAGAADWRADNAAALVALLQRDDGSLLTQDAVTGGDNVGYTGLVPGLALVALAEAGRPEATLAFDAVDLSATGTGHFEEGHGADHLPLPSTHTRDGLGSDVPARYRPWEGGVSVAGVLRYLLGDHPDATMQQLRLSPHLPAGWPSVRGEGLRMGEERYDLALWGFEEGQVLQVSRPDSPAGAEAWTLEIRLGSLDEVATLWVDGVATEVPAGGVATVDGVALAPGGQVEIVAAYR